MADNERDELAKWLAGEPRFDWDNADAAADAILSSSWLAGKLKQARADALEEALAALIEAAPPLNAELSMRGGDGPFTDPGMSAYVEGFHDAHSAIRALKETP